jgi:mycothiol S-conjugate amidase
MLAAGLESPYSDWLERWSTRPERPVTTHVPCAEYFEVRDRALLAHATQIDPDGPWFVCPLDLQMKVWPTEDYELARSVIGVRLPEDDLFAGVRERVEVAV